MSGWIYNIPLEDVKGDYSLSDGKVVLYAGGASNKRDGGDAILIFNDDKLNISSLNMFRWFHLHIKKISTIQTNFTNDSLEVFLSLGVYYPNGSFDDLYCQIEGDSTNTWKENETASYEKEGFNQNTYNIPENGKIAAKLSITPKHEDFQARFELDASKISLDLENVNPDSYYYVLCNENGGILQKIESSKMESIITYEPAKSGYSFVGWSDGANIYPKGTPLPTQVATEIKPYTSDMTFYAVWTNEYTITVLAQPENRGTVSGGGKYSNGKTVTITATPYSSYKFVEWDDGVTDNPRNITVTSNATYIAKFRPDREYLYLDLDFLEGCSGYGIELISGSLYDNSYSKFYPNSKIKITARAENGYEFAFWEDGSTENPRNIHIIDDDVTAYAVFQKSIGSNVYIGNVLYDIYRGDKLMDVYVGNILI